MRVVSLVALIPAIACPLCVPSASGGVKGDPAEPAPRLLVVFGGDALLATFKGPADPLADRRTHEVISGARGTTVKVNTPGTGQGVAMLKFEGCAPPMRFVVKLSRVPANDLRELAVVSGRLKLELGGGGSVARWRYFDGDGRELESSDGAAYLVRGGRDKGKDITVELHRRPGATLDKTVSLTWDARRLVRGRCGDVLLVD